MLPAARIVLFLCLTPVVASAQRTWLVPLPDRGAAIEAATAFYEEDLTSGLTLTLVPSVRFPVGGGIVATADLPISRASVRPGFLGASTTATIIGNPWLGIELPLANAGRLELGLRPGLVQPDDAAEAAAAQFGAITEYDRFEMWSGKTTTARGVVHLGRLPAQGPFLSVRVGASVFVPSGTGGDTEVLANYGLRGGVIAGRAMYSIAMTGRALVTSQTGSVADRSVHQVALGIESLEGQVRPHLQARIFVDEYTDGIQAVIAGGFAWGW